MKKKLIFILSDEIYNDYVNMQESYKKRKEEQYRKRRILKKVNIMIQ